MAIGALGDTNLGTAVHDEHIVDEVGAAVAARGVDGHVAAGAGVGSHALRVAADRASATWTR